MQAGRPLSCSPAREPKPKEVHKLISSSAQRCSIPLLGPRDPARAMPLPGFGWVIWRTTGNGMVTAGWERMSHGPLSVSAQPVEATGPASPTPSAYIRHVPFCQVVRQRSSKLKAAYLSLSRSDKCAASVCKHACEIEPSRESQLYGADLAPPTDGHGCRCRSACVHFPTHRELTVGRL